MNEIRNNIYTLYNGVEYMLGRNRDGDFQLFFYGKNCPDATFEKIDGNDTYKKVISDCTLIDNAFFVTTYGQYKGFIFQINSLQGSAYRITTSDKSVFESLSLTFVDRGWYEKWVSYDELESIWEERSPSAYGLPMPEGLERIKYIKPPPSGV